MTPTAVGLDSSRLELPHDLLDDVEPPRFRRELDRPRERGLDWVDGNGADAF